jgi:hypothetical protein
MRTLSLVLNLFLLLQSALLAQAGSSVMSVILTEDLRTWNTNKSFILVTEADGTQTNLVLERITGVGSIREVAIKANEKRLVETLNQYLQKGWKILSVNSINYDSEGSAYLTITRYVLEKKIE